MFVPPFSPNAYADLSLAVLDGPEAHPASAVTPGVPGPAGSPRPSRVVLAVGGLAAAAIATVIVSIAVVGASRRG